MKKFSITSPYLQVMIAKNEPLKDFFGINRRRRPQSNVAYNAVFRQVQRLNIQELTELIGDAHREVKSRLSAINKRLDAVSTGQKV